ncbi:MAG: MT-A70 family methyltransferase [Candidatus Nitrosocaldus sp.]
MSEQEGRSRGGGREGRRKEEIYFLSLTDIKEKEEYRSLLPLIVEEDYNRLKEDIEKRGIQLPLIVNSNKVLLDGYTRLRIARELGIQHIPCIIRTFDNELEEKEFVLTINVYRRHLNTAQRVEVAIRLLAIEKERALLRKLLPLKQYRRIAYPIIHIVSDTDRGNLPLTEGLSEEEGLEKEKSVEVGVKVEERIEEGIEEEEEKKSVEEVEEEGRSKLKGKAREVAARKAGISDKTLRKGLEIKEHAKKDQEIAELWNKALRGEVSLEHAYSELKRKEQHERLQSLLLLQQQSNNNSNNNNNNNNDNNKKKSKKFNVILADPPWQYEFGLRGNAEQHYPCLSLEDIVKVFEEHKEEIAYPCIIFLWATAPKLREALQLLDMLGFEYKTNMVWVKDRIGTGYYVRNKHELLLIAVKGDIPIPLEDSRPESVIVAERKGEHSRKPDIVYDIIERMYPNCSYLELFAREKRREGWEAYGLDLSMA